MDYPTLIKNITDASFFNDERGKILFNYTKNKSLDETLFLHLSEIINLFSVEIRIQVLIYLVQKINCESTKYLVPHRLSNLLRKFNDDDKVLAIRIIQPFLSEIPFDNLYTVLLHSEIYKESNINEIANVILTKTHSINGSDVSKCINLFKMDDNKINFINIVCHKTTFSEIDVAKILDSFIYPNNMTDVFLFILNRSKNFLLDDDNILFICRSLQPKFRNIFINILVESPKINGGISIKNTLPYILICSILSKYLNCETYMSYIDKYIKTRENVDNSVCDIFKPVEKNKMSEDILIQAPQVDNWINVLKKSLVSQGHKILSETISIHDGMKNTIIVFSNGSNVIYSEKI
ncbi:hypothetical protein ma806 [Moumouvirus australiensis]|uniref:Uncharacterized protein n=1 Tax=Moumouvirus australiensis TaxID=2109587 RepID=A0A2P1EMT9_9VIRU|nr:hypothetical protein QKC55_gp098 [Moumouvirus australiensis]AVL95193.1 hypothetical protein ma806 [Moumouvirus australiensis]